MCIVFAQILGTLENRKTSIIQASQASLIALVSATRHGWNRTESVAAGDSRSMARRRGGAVAVRSVRLSREVHLGTLTGATPRRVAPRRTVHGAPRRFTYSFLLRVPARSHVSRRLRRAFRHRLCLSFVFRDTLCLFADTFVYGVHGNWRTTAVLFC